MLVGGVVDHQFGDHLDAAAMRLAHELAKFAHAAVGAVDVAVIGDVVAVVAERRRIERQEPDRGDAEVLKIVESLREAGEVADAVAIGIVE